MRYLQGMRGRLERWLWAGAVALAVALAGLALWRIASSPAGLVLPRSSDSPWIRASAPVTAAVHQWGEVAVPVVSFVAAFEAQPGARPLLEVRALGDFSVFVNGRTVALEVQDGDAPLRDWKAFARLDLAGFAKPGRNAIRVNVRNAHGPALLSLRMWQDLDGTRSLLLSTARGWRAGVERADGEPREPGERSVAVLASDVAPHVSAALGERAPESLAAHWLGVGLCFGLGIAAFLLFEGSARESSALVGRLPLVAAALVVAGWLHLFLTKFGGLDLALGFDAGSHLAYADWLVERRSLPGPSDGWSMYHPPLFYLVSVALAGLAEGLGASRELALKLLPWLSGLALVAISRQLVRRLLPGDSPAEAAAILFAGWLPMNLTLAAYYTNEGFHAALASLAILAAVGLLLARDPKPRALALFSLWLGLALLVKFTSVLLAGVLGAALAIRIAVASPSAPSFGLRAGRAYRAYGAYRAYRLCCLVAPALAVAGWFYARNLLLYGQPLVGNWSAAEPGKIWWSEPGFHTLDYYWGFGESLSRPFLASFVSFWDALYSTAWGDGLLAGQGGIRARHGLWSYDWMAAGYLLALPATGLLLTGLGLACRDMLRDPDARRRSALAALVALSAVMGFATFWVTLELPYFGQAKAFYSLALVPVAAFFFATGCGWLDGLLGAHGGRFARAPLYGWLAAFFGVVYLSFAA